MSRALFDAAEFTPLKNPQTLTWGSLRDFSQLLPLLAVPVADTELLHLSHYGPIAIHIPADPMALPVVVLLTHPTMARVMQFSPEGKWLAPYLPLSLRALPFAPGIKGECLYSPSLVITSSAQNWRVETAPNKPTPEFRAALDMVQRIYAGVRRLSDAARLLMAADVLVPIEALEAYPGARFLVVSAEKLASLAADRAAALTAIGLLPLEVAAASLFSRRHLLRRIDTSVPRAEAAPGFAPTGATLHAAPLPPELAEENFALDTSTLFNIDEFSPLRRPE